VTRHSWKPLRFHSPKAFFPPGLLITPTLSNSAPLTYFRPTLSSMVVVAEFLQASRSHLWGRSLVCLEERSSKRCLVPREKTLVAARLALLLAKSFTLSLVKSLSPLISQIFSPSYLSNLRALPLVKSLSPLICQIFEPSHLSNLWVLLFIKYLSPPHSSDLWALLFVRSLSPLIRQIFEPSYQLAFYLFRLINVFSSEFLRAASVVG